MNYKGRRIKLASGFSKPTYKARQPRNSIKKKPLTGRMNQGFYIQPNVLRIRAKENLFSTYKWDRAPTAVVRALPQAGHHPARDDGKLQQKDGRKPAFIIYT